MKNLYQTYHSSQVRFVRKAIVLLLFLTCLLVAGFSSQAQTAPFITTWKTDNPGVSDDNQITIPTLSTGYDYTVDWGDGNTDMNVTGEITHTYASAGTYTVSITGDFPAISFGNTGDKDKILTVEQWGDIVWDGMVSAFFGCSNLDVVAVDAPDLSTALSLSGAFRNCTSFNGNIGNWDVSNITSMRRLFAGASAFNADISSWNVSAVTDMLEMFTGATSFNQPIGSWNVGAVTSMHDMFRNAPEFNQDISGWNVGNVEDFSYMFNFATNFNQPIGGWNMSSATNVRNMFNGATNFNQPLASWDMSNVTNMTAMFNSATNFDQPIGGWNVSSVETINGMFSGARAFNQDISGWNTSNMTNLSAMFNTADAFNQDISGWDLSSAETLISMFFRATSFDQDLSGWDVSGVTDMTSMFNESALSKSNYDKILIGWSQLTLQNNVVFGTDNLPYCNGADARQSIIDNFSWTITDGGEVCNAFITTWKTDNPGTSEDNQITIPITGGGYNYTVDWGDGNTSTDITDGITHTYATPGTYTVSITGDFPRINFDVSGDKEKLLTIEQWGDIAWTSFERAFMGCVNLTSPANDSPDLSNVTDVSWMFRDCSAFDGDVSNWEVSNVQDFGLMFLNATNFNSDISGWDMSNATAINAMVQNVPQFNFDIGGWDVSNVTDMNGLFFGCPNFNQDISSWDVSNVEDMRFLFGFATSFNQDISNWNTSSVTDMSAIFRGATAFNLDISTWDVSNVSTLEDAFSGASQFNQNLSDWDVSSATTMVNMFTGTSLSKANYDRTLQGWSQLTLQNDVTLDAPGIDYCYGADARQSIIDNFNWTINDGDEVCNAFITTWKTDNTGTSEDNQITIPTTGTGYDYTVDWGDGNTDVNATGDMTHTYASAGTYTVTISGDFPRIYFDNTSDKDKILTIEQWGDIQWVNMERAFFGCSNLNITATDAPDLSSVNSLRQMFASATSLNADINHWDVSAVTNLDNLFNGASAFNQDLDNWDVSNVTGMVGTFGNTTEFNGNITTWDVSNVTNMLGLFTSAFSFNQPIGNWEVGNVTNMTSVFRAASAFNQDIGAWDVSKVTTFRLMFDGASAFDQDIGDWNTGAATDMSFMFRQTPVFNQPIGSWDVSSVTTMESMFQNAAAFNQDLNSWDVSSVRDMQQMFRNTDSFNGSIGNWDVSIVLDMSRMFDNARSFDQPIGSWNVGSVSRMDVMFQDTPFNQPINDWDVSSVTNFFGMFFRANSFNQDLSDWDVSSATDLGRMFGSNTGFNGDVSSWNVSNVTNFFEVFGNATAFNQDLGNWNVSAGTDFTNIFGGSSLSKANYDRILEGWSQLTLQSDVAFGAADTEYCFGADARQSIIDNFNWTITDGGEVCNAFITTWKTDNAGTSDDNQITIPTTGSGYNYTVDWGDGNSDSDVTGDITHTYASAGTYTVSISGDFPRIYFNNEGDKEKILTIEQWGDIQWTSMNLAFFGCSNLTYNATDVPDLSEVTDLFGMFFEATSFDGAVGNWDVSNVTNMQSLFGETSFNQDISDWDVSSVTSMTAVFFNTPFNHDISGWDVSNVTTMRSLFLNASDFNQDIGDWDVSSVTDLQTVFTNASSFDQDLSGWDVSSVLNMTNTFNGSALSKRNYDKILEGWSQLTLQNDVALGANFTEYCNGAAARQSIIDNFNWTITDAGENCEAFITTWKTDNPGASDDNQITIPTLGGGYDYTVDWGDGNSDSEVTGNITHTYASPGTYTVSITGDFPRIGFNNTGDREKILSIEQWGDIQWTSFVSAFYGCSNLTITASDAPDLSGVASLSSMFRGASSLNTNINHWDVSNVTDMGNLFMAATSFNQPLDNWDVSNVTIMANTLRATTVFTQDISGWDVSNVTTMSGMFFGASSFNSDISGWDVSNVTNMTSLFNQAVAFNQDISEWDVSSVTEMVAMFSQASSFDQNLGGWDVSNLADATNMFVSTNLSKANYDNLLLGWSQLTLQEDVPFRTSSRYCNGSAARQSIIDNFNWTFTDGGENCQAFVTTWKTDNPGPSDDNQITIPTNGSGYDYTVDWGDGTSDTGVTGDITHTYASAGTYTVSITGDFPSIQFNNEGDKEKLMTIEQWGDIQWNSMSYAFSGCTNMTYNATDAPNLSDVTSMIGTFRFCSSFNGDISNWNTSNITAFMFLFQNASSFNQDIGNWDTENVINMRMTFVGASSFNQDLGDWNTSNVTTMWSMFGSASSFNQDISGWNTGNVNDMRDMFFSATAFNQDLSSWDVSSVTQFNSIFSGSSLSRTNYDKILIGWSQLALQSDLTIGIGSVEYCLGADARQSIIDNFNWTINDGGENCIVNIPDANFKAALLANTSINTVDDGEITIQETVGVNNIQVSGLEIADLTGIEAFADLNVLGANSNLLTSIDLSGNTGLDFLSLFGNDLNEIDLGNNPTLIEVNLRLNNLTAIDLSNNASITRLFVHDNAIEAIDVSNLADLQILVVSNNELTSLDVSNNALLQRLELNGNELNTLDLSANTALTRLVLSATDISSLDLSANTALVEFFMSSTPITSLDLSNNGALTRVVAINNDQLKSIDLRNGNNASITDLNLVNNPLLACINVDDLAFAEANFTDIDATASFSLDCRQDAIDAGQSLFDCLVASDIEKISLTGDVLVGTSTGPVDFSVGSVIGYQTSEGRFGKMIIKDLEADVNYRMTLDYITYNADGAVHSQMTDFQVPGTWNMDLDEGALVESGVNLEKDFFWSRNTSTQSTLQPTNGALYKVIDVIVEIPDANFKTALLDYTPAIDTNDDGEIQFCEAKTYTGTIAVNELSIVDLAGIEAFLNLTRLDAVGNDLTELNLNSNRVLEVLFVENNSIGSIDLSFNTELTSLRIFGNELTTLDLANNTQLTYIQASSNQLSALDVTDLTNLQNLFLGSNQLTGIDVSQNAQLQTLEVLSNNITSLDLTNNPSLITISMANNEVSVLDLTQNSSLNRIWVANNELTDLDLSQNAAATDLSLSGNQLVSLNIANGNNVNVTAFDATSNPDLTCITVDDVAFAEANFTNVDAAANFSLDCSNVETDILTFSLAEQTAPATIDAVNHTIAIEVSGGTAVTALVPTFTLSSGATADPASGTTVDFSSTASINVTAENPSISQEWLVDVTVGNVAPTDISLSASSIDENNAVGDVIGTLTSTDLNGGDTHTYTLVAGEGDTDNASFDIDGDALEAAEVFDFEAQSSYSIRIETNDGNGGTFQKEFTITINDLDENVAPTDITLSESTIDENNAVGDVIGTFTSTDANTGDAHSYTLVGGEGDTDNASFTIDGDALEAAEVFDFEAQSSYSIRVETNDGNGGTFQKEFTITINDVDENVAPTDISLSESSIDENNAIGTTIGTLSTTDANSEDSHTYLLVSGEGDTDNASFTIAGEELRATASFDFETRASYSIRLETNDGNGGTFQKTFTITINDVDENVAPTVASAIQDVEQEEGFASFTIDLSQVFSDADGDNLTYNAVSSNTSVVTATIGSSQLVITETGIGTSTILITADDGNGGSAFDEFTVTVTEMALGLEEELDLQVYPNPVVDFVNIRAQQPVSVELSDINGRVVSRDFGGQVRMDVRSLSKGVYLLTIRQGEEILRKRIIK